MMLKRRICHDSKRLKICVCQSEYTARSYITASYRLKRCKQMRQHNEYVRYPTMANNAARIND